MKVNDIPVKKDANQVTDPNTQVSAEEFNALVGNAKESVTSMAVLAGQEEVKLSYGKGKGTSSALTFPTATAAGAGMMSPKQAARIADRTATDSMGYVVLDKDKAFAEQVTHENTIYEIRHDFDLGGLPADIPKKCIFKFEGGSLNNGTIRMYDAASSNYDTLEIIATAYQIFKNIDIVGEFTSDRISIEWFGAVGDGKTDCTEAFRYAIKTLNATLYNGNYYGKNYAVHLNANRTYVVTGTLNHYDGEDHDVYSISFVGEKYAQVEDYQAGATRGGGIQINTSNVSLFANAKIRNAAFINVSVQGLYHNWVADNVRFFDNCDIANLLICNCYIQYIYTMFYNSSVHNVSRIHDNTFLGVYNFSYHEGGIDWQKAQLVDSSIYGNYINGGAPSADKVPEIDNYFCTWYVINGSEIHHNFIDYYATVYGGGVSAESNINSNHNHYQVFRYFHLTSKIYSINDYFNWNDPEAPAIKDVFSRFKVRTLNGNDGITYDIPPYIATDSYIDNGDTVFKDMILERNIANVIMRRGGSPNSKGSKFIVELHEYSFARNNAIVKTGGYQQVSGQNSVYLQTLSSQEISIDKRLAHVVETLPTKAELLSGAFGLYGIGEYVKCGNQYYKMKCVWGGNGVMSYGLVKENPDFMSLGTEGVLTYVSSNKFDVYSKTCFISTKFAAGNEAKYKVESFTIPESLTSEIVTFYFDGLIVFNNLKNRYGGALALNAGDSLSVMRDINGRIIVIGYYCAAENNTTGLTTARPTSPSTGQCFFDTTLGKPIWWNGSAWVDVTGATV